MERSPARRIPVPPKGGHKDDSGAFTKRDLSIDGLLKVGLEAIYGIMHASLHDTSTGVPSRESVMNLKDAMAMLHELRKQEQAILEGMSEEDIEKAAKGD